MNVDFYHGKFNDATLVKLMIFRRYIRSWLPVFMTDSKSGYGHSLERINIYDFFSGPGVDGENNPGSPLIIQDEVKKFCETRSSMKTQTPVRMIFNDINLLGMKLKRLNRV